MRDAAFARQAFQGWTYLCFQGIWVVLHAFISGFRLSCALCSSFDGPLHRRLLRSSLPSAHFLLSSATLFFTLVWFLSCIHLPLKQRAGKAGLVIIVSLWSRSGLFLGASSLLSTFIHLPLCFWSLVGFTSWYLIGFLPSLRSTSPRFILLVYHCRLFMGWLLSPFHIVSLHSISHRFSTSPK